MTPWVVFDDGCRDLRPLTDLRASFDLRTGAVTTLQRLARHCERPADGMFVPPAMAAILAEEHHRKVNHMPEIASLLWINGRVTAWRPPGPVPANTVWLTHGGDVVAAQLDRAKSLAFAEAGCSLTDALRQQVRLEVRGEFRLLTHPWDVLEHAQRHLVADLLAMGRGRQQMLHEPAPRVTIVGDHAVWVADSATIHPHVVLDTSAGPIIIDEGATVRSMSVMVGPGYIGPDSIVCNHAHIRAGTVVGPACKVGGEVNGCIFQGYSNKSHSGYLGNSFVGQWVNLGASTVTSNLKNTYGMIRMQTEIDGPVLDTGRQFLGSILGDHVKTAIGTRLLTGSCMGTGTMLALSHFPPKCTRRFSFHTDGGEQSYEPEKFFAVAREMMQRRKADLSEAMMLRIRQLMGESG